MGIFEFSWVVPHSIACWLTYGYMAWTHISVCVCVSVHVLRKCKMWGLTSLFLNMKPFSDTKLCNKVIFFRSVTNSRHQKTLNTMLLHYISKDMNVLLTKCDEVHKVFFKDNSLQLYFPWMEMLAITDWHTCAIYAAIYINLIWIFKAFIQLLLIYVTKHSPCIKEVNI